MRIALIAVLLLLTCLALPGATRRHVRHGSRLLRMQATAFFRSARPTAAGTTAREGIVAADPSVLPLGSRILLSGAGAYNGIYTVADTGGRIKGRRIDIFVASAAAARRFGRRMVTVQLLPTGSASGTR